MNFFLKFYKNFHNIIEFNIRKNIRFSRGEYIYKNESKDCLFGDIEKEKRKILEKKEEYFRENYNLQNFYENSSIKLYIRNLLILELFEQYIEILEKNTISILDVGSKNWEYIFAEYYFFSHIYDEKKIKISGIELDAYRRYKDFYTRYDYAQSYIKNFKNSQYIVGDFLKHNDNYDHIIWLFPFIIQSPLINWGLPLKFFKPERMLQHGWNLLKKNGFMLIVNQFYEEYKLQSEYLENLNINHKKMGIFCGSFSEKKIDWFVTLIKKPE